MIASDELASLTAFCVGNAELDDLETLLSQFNLFEAAGLTREEIRHSRFLSFLLNPHESHGLGDRFVTRFLQAAVHDRPLDAINVSALELELMDLTDLDVACEVQNIDVLLLSQSNKFAVVIENKVGTAEHSGQLQRYLNAVQAMRPGWRVLPVLLSPEGTTPSDHRYFPISYAAVATILRQLISTGSLGSEVAIAITHYERLIRRHVVTDAHLNELCDQIIAKHRKALELLVERMGDPKSSARKWIWDELQAIGFKQEGNLLLPEAWVNWMPAGNGRPWLVYFFVLISESSAALYIEIGPGEERARRAVYDGAKAHGSPFWTRTKQTSVYTRILYTYLVKLNKGDTWAGDDWKEAASTGIDSIPGLVEQVEPLLKQWLEAGKE